MDEMNKYNESVIIPFLQKKFQELTNQAMILEVNLLIERQKNLELQTKLNEYEAEVSETPKLQRKKKNSEQVLDASTY